MAENHEAFDITIYSDGDQIVNKYKTQFDIILMDIEMKSFKKKFSKIKTGVIMAVMLVVQSGFMVVTEDISLFFWIPCMMVAVFLMLFFIYASCAIEITDAV